MPKLKQPLTGDERLQARHSLISRMERGDITIGLAIRTMRREWAGLSQGKLGSLVGVSANTISAIERDADNATMSTLRKVLRVFGMRLAILPKPSPTKDRAIDG